MCLLIAVTALQAPAQRAAVIAPDNTARSREFAEALRAKLADNMTVLDLDLSRSAYLSVSPSVPFNLTGDESKRIGSAVGCDAFLLVRVANQRRSSFGRAEYYEAYAVIYVVSSRTGRLIWWKLASHEASSREAADQLLNSEIEKLSDGIAGRIRLALRLEINEALPLLIEEVPAEGSPLAQGFRPPVPYRRIKPEYTPQAALYEIAATVEALVDLDRSGAIQRIDITRWAGFGLEESVETAIRAMNWRPAERNGKTLPMRFLLRYNFKKLDKDPPAQ